ncbi:YlbD family protein [Virgibacillus ndiopensis]|uniref:YlbD family protein n=1 Tax=Virgibacillus ndiopensis TaxID=2004408 RepID=UPI000C06C783|nr:spore coat protein YlbD [Virgibacillus ndiopensis]
MNEDNLHPTVREFKAFLQKHPKLIEEVRKSGQSWQDYYEKWVLLGEEDPFWEPYKEENNTEKNKKKGGQKQSEIVGQLLKLTENIDLNKVQKQAEQLSTTLSTVQEVLGQFKDTKGLPKASMNQNQRFNWFRD